MTQRGMLLPYFDISTFENRTLLGGPLYDILLVYVIKHNQIHIQID